MPVLREISASCGIALRVEPAHWGAARAALAACELAPGEYAFYAVSFSPPALRVRPRAISESDRPPCRPNNQPPALSKRRGVCMAVEFYPLAEVGRAAFQQGLVLLAGDVAGHVLPVPLGVAHLAEHPAGRGEDALNARTEPLGLTAMSMAGHAGEIHVLGGHLAGGDELTSPPPWGPRSGPRRGRWGWRGDPPPWLLSIQGE